MSAKMSSFRRVTLEPLEDRLVPALSTSFNGGIIIIISDVADDTILVGRDTAGNFLLNGGAIEGNPNSATTEKIRIFGGGGNDTIELTQQADGPLLIAGGAGESVGQTEIEVTLDAGPGMDTLKVYGLRGSTPNMVALGTAGINVNGDNDVDLIPMGFEAIHVIGGSGDDIFTAAGNALVGGPYPRRVIFEGLEGNDLLLGGMGSDLLIGGEGNDRLYGLWGFDTLQGDDGNDILAGGTGDDVLEDGEGNDVLSGQQGNDRYHFSPVAVPQIDKVSEVAGWGRDFLDFEALSSTDALVVNLSARDYNLAAHPNRQVQTLLPAQALNFEDARGGAGEDLLIGNAWNNRLWGGDGNDRLYGLAGNDVLDGGLGQDTLYGGLGQDVLLGGSGDDVLFGQQGNDALGGNQGDDQLFGGVGLDRHLLIEEFGDFDQVVGVER